MHMANRTVLWKAGSANLLDGTEMVLREKPKASAGHVVVRMTTRTVYVEELLALELRPLCSEKVVVGVSGCGLVQELGEGVSMFNLGQRVLPLLLSSLYEKLGEGSWQDYISVPEEDLLAVPDSIPNEIAAQLENAWTAYALLLDLSLPNGEYLLQTAAGSSVGRLVIRLARRWGLKTINIVRRDEVKEELKHLGADEVINSTTEDILARVKEITRGKGAYVGVDCVGGPISKTVASCIRDGGQMLAIGSLESKDFVISFMDLSRGIKLKSWDVSPHCTQAKDVRDKEAMEVVKLLEEKIFESRPIWKRFPLENFKEAILEVQANRGRQGIVMITS
ncbi:hypothetical protein O6H91_02G067800 [Diphasiastrum complanatum]|uniref:Uncharacterized protein n=1 Tax=Diphasiastrum complanatum TaxID=34168 RepID=A0ACC2EGI8_DIPCM|nr:hypothetical protein O6H91_02G067800 [Diphasiastrum complanatum]